MYSDKAIEQIRELRDIAYKNEMWEAYDVLTAIIANHPKRSIVNLGNNNNQRGANIHINGDVYGGDRTDGDAINGNKVEIYNFSDRKKLW